MLSTHINGSVAHIVIDDGGLNIITPIMLSKFIQALQFVESNSEVSTLVIEGNGRSFSAGLDTGVLQTASEEAEKLLRDTGELLLNLYRSRLRIVSLCAGHAAAAGALILLVSDYRVGVSQSGKIGLSEVANGVPLSSLALDLATDRLNTRDRFAATALSRMYSPDQACEAGFLDVTLSNYRDARYHAMQEAERLSKLDDAMYLQALLGVREQTLSKYSDS